MNSGKPSNSRPKNSFARRDADKALPSLGATPALPAIAKPLLAAVRDDYRPFVPQDALHRSAFELQGVPAYGLLGTTRLLQSKPVQIQHTRHALYTSIPNFHLALLPFEPTFLGSLLSPQVMFDGFGDYAARVAECTTFGEVLALKPAYKRGDHGLKRLVE
ncbi:MAG: hypothetical protein EOO38_08845, partial [Cytophagaceae bacterium]